MNRQTDSSGFIQDSPGYGLPDPPGSIGGKLVAFLVIKTENSTHQPKIAFLDQVGQGQPLVHVAFGNGDHKAKVCPDHGILGNLNGPVIGLQLGVYFKQLAFVLVFTGGNFYTVPHVVELLFFGL